MEMPWHDDLPAILTSFDSAEPFTDGCGWQRPLTSRGSRAPPASTPNRPCAATWPGAPNRAWTCSPPGGRTWSSISGGCRRSAGSSPPRCPAGSPSRPGSAGPASWTALWSTHPQSTSAAPQSLPNRRPWGSLTCSSRPCSPLHASHRTGMTSRSWPCSACSACGSSKPPARTSPTWVRSTVTGCCGCAARAPRSFHVGKRVGLAIKLMQRLFEKISEGCPSFR